MKSCDGGACPESAPYLHRRVVVVLLVETLLLQQRWLLVVSGAQLIRDHNPRPLCFGLELGS